VKLEEAARSFVTWRASPSIVVVIKTRKVRSSGHVARIGRLEIHTKARPGNLRGRENSENLGVNGRTIRMDDKEIG